MARRARQQEQQKRREAEREAALGFNPRPSKFMDLDQLQHQGRPPQTAVATLDHLLGRHGYLKPVLDVWP